MSGILATRTIVAANQINYLWPQYSLPWNNFFGKVRPTPYYISNQLRNITIRQIQSPLTYSSDVNVNFDRDADKPRWGRLMGRRTSKPISEQASKVFVGRYFDNAAGIQGLEYQYDLTGSQVLIDDDISSSDDGILLLSANLANQTLTQNLPVYVDTAVCDPCHDDVQKASLNRCKVGDDDNFFNTLTGVVSLNGKSYIIKNALPYKDKCHKCDDDDEDSTAWYNILGNKLYLAVPVDKEQDGDDFRYVSYVLTVRVVEVNPRDGLGLPLAEGNLPPYFPLV